MQRNLPTIQGKLHEAWYDLFKVKVKSFASSRTDAQVHAKSQWIKIISQNEVLDFEYVIDELTKRLPVDIQIISFHNCPPKFDIMGGASWKEYRYHFASPPITESEYHLNFNETLDIELMKLAAGHFIGRGVNAKYFHLFQRRESEKVLFQREIFVSEICVEYKTHYFRVIAPGFMRQMVRIMVGALLNVGQGRVSLVEFEESLKKGATKPVGFVAPGYGLCLQETNFNDN